MRKLLLSLIISIAATGTATAADMSGRDILIPVVARTPGVLGTQWYTDLVLTNVTRNSTGPAQVFVTFVVNGAEIWITESLEPRESLVLPDVVQNTFDLDQAIGYVRVTAFGSNTRISARARVFNRGGAGGEYGQSVLGVPTDSLTTEHFLPGLSGVNGNRSAVGVTNPWNIPVQVTLELFEANGQSKGTYPLVVGARSVLQLNNFFEVFQTAGFDGALVRLKSTVPVFGYGTVVRNDTGDSTFVVGSGVATGNDILVPVVCSNPAPVTLAPPDAQSAGNWIVIFNDDVVSATTLANQIASRVGFTVTFVYEAGFKGFTASLTPQQLAAVRCEAGVKVVEENIQVPIP